MTAVPDSFLTGLADITHVILDTTSSPGALHQSVSAYADLLERVNSVEAFRFSHIKALHLPGGDAIDPITAAVCIRDYNRTVQFVRGLHAAIQQAQQQYPETTVHVFYAGTGPYAALMLPLTTRFSAKEVQFSLVEAHPVSFQLLQHTIRHLQLEDYVRNYIPEDATTLTLSGYGAVHILVTETMQKALKKEPQVSITRHLAPQLAANAFFIPERIHVWAGLSDPAAVSRNVFLETNLEVTDHPLDSLIELTRNSPDMDSNGVFPEITIDLPETISASFPELTLYTQVDIFANFRLLSGESVITLPHPVLHIQKQQYTRNSITFQYHIKDEPGFKIIDKEIPENS